MEQYNMRANFYPLKEPINGFVGSANLAISNIIKMYGIAVFKNREDDGYHIQFPGFGDGKDAVSYVTPASKEAYAQMLDVVEKAISAEDHFGHVAGKKRAFLTVSGRAVDEPYADGRYDLKVADICTIHGLTTQQVDYVKDGQESTFTAIRVPSLPPYEKDGEKVYPPIFKGLKSSYEVDGQPKETDYAQVIQALVIAERKKILGKAPLESQVQNAAEKASQRNAEKNAPAKDIER